MFSLFPLQPNISVHTIEGSDRLQEHLLKLHSPSQLHLANCIKSLLIGGLSEETGCHFVSFRIHPNFAGSGRNIWLELKYFYSTTCKSVCSKCGLNADGVGRSFSPSAIFSLNKYHLFDGNDVQGWLQKWKHSQKSLIYDKLLKVLARIDLRRCFPCMPYLDVTQLKDLL